MIALAEANDPSSDMLKRLNGDRVQWHLLRSGCDRIRVFTRFAGRYLQEKSNTRYTSVRELTTPGLQHTVLVGIVHLPSKLHVSRESQILIAGSVSEEIDRLEKVKKHKRTIVFGDFNMDPFEPGMVAAGALHSVFGRVIAAEQTRIVHGRQYTFFYNPMWSHYQDEPGRPSGSYFSRRAEEVCQFWHVFDQVIVRPELLPFFTSDAVRIVHSIGDQTLIDNQGKPRTQFFPDHLPLSFELLLQ